MQIATIILFIIFSIKTIFSWVYVWQLKEYRLDRLFVHMRDTKNGKDIFFSLEFFLALLGIFLYVSSLFFYATNEYIPIVVFVIFLFSFFVSLKDFFYKKIKRPQFTIKAVGVSFISFLLVVFLLLFPLTELSVWLLCITILFPFVIAFSVFLFSFPTEIYTDWLVQKAHEKRKKLKHLTVVAVSGSYGKSSTKEVLAQVFSKKFSVVKTELSHNTPLAIAKCLLEKVTPTTDFFIVELGAYTRGELAYLADMVMPTISITTAISDQHLALYGSMQNVFLSELELIERLPKDAFVLLNKNSREMENFASMIKHKQILWYGTKKSRSQKANEYIAYNVEPTSSGVSWRYVYKNEVLLFKSSLLGIHTIENILPAVILGFQYGMSQKDIEKSLQTLLPLPKTMEMKTILPGIFCIDDTFNASPESVKSAIDYLLLCKKRKLLVMSPLIELGRNARERHREIGENIAHLDYVFLTNTNYLKDIEKGIRTKTGKVKVIIGSYKIIAKKIQDILKKGDVIIFEGKEAGIVLSYI